MQENVDLENSEYGQVLCSVPLMSEKKQNSDSSLQNSSQMVLWHFFGTQSIWIFEFEGKFSFLYSFPLAGSERKMVVVVGEMREI